MDSIIGKIKTCNYKIKFRVLLGMWLLIWLLIGYFLFCYNFKIDSNKFEKVFKDKNYVIIDILELYMSLDSYNFNNIGFDEFYQAYNSDMGSKIWFITANDEERVEDMFGVKKNSIINEQDSWNNVNYNNELSYSNYTEYTLCNDNTYYSVVKLNKTMIYIEMDRKFEDEIPDIFDALGISGYKKISSCNTICSVIFFTLLMILLIIDIICKMKVFKKAGRKGWYVLIPYFSFYHKSMIAFRSAYGLLLLFVPLGDYVLNYNLFRAFGKSRLVSLLGTFVPPIVFGLIALDDSKYMYD